MVSSANCVKLLAAGCVVGLLAGVPVRAEADAVEPVGEDMGEYDAPLTVEDMGDDMGYDMGDEVPAEDMGEEDAGEEEVAEEDVGEEDVSEEDTGEEDVPEEEEVMDGEEDTEVMDGEEDTEVMDVFEPPEEAPEEDVEEVEPEMGDVMAPGAAEEEEEEEIPDGLTAPDADPEMLAALGYIASEGIDYIPSATNTDVMDITMSVVESAEECAEECDNEPGCNIAAYITADYPNGFNCWLKNLSPGCTVPAATTPLENGWLLVSETKCDAVFEGTAPMAAAMSVAGTGTYTQYPGFDYVPAGVTGAPTAVTITDIGTGENAGLLVDDVAGCEAACDLEPSCNMASYYIEPLATGKNCYLKILGNSCELPADALEEPNAIMSLKCVEAAGPLAAAPAAVAPAAANGTADPSAGPDDSGMDSRGVDVPESGNNTVPEEGSPAAGLYISAVVVALAGAAALL